MAHHLAHGNSNYGEFRDVRYTYDELNRLINVNDSKQDVFDEIFAYDAQGRIVAQRRDTSIAKNIGGEYAYYANTNRLKSVADGMGGSADERKMSDTANFVYDSEGNLVEDRSKGLKISYDWRGMPVEFKLQDEENSSDTARLSMMYDGSGRRISKTFLTKSATAASWDTVKVTHYTGIGTEVREEFHNGTREKVNVVVNMPQGLGRYGIEDATDPFKGISLDENGKPTSWSALNPKFEWFLKNHLGSTMLVYGTVASTDPNTADIGETKAAYDYRAFGEMVELMPHDLDKVTENFTGKEHDDEIALDYFGARYLDPMLGMWISVDPKRQFNSPYLYAGNGVNPVNGVDGDGNFLMMGEGQSDEFRDNVVAAIDYLNAYGAAGEIARLHSQEETVYLVELKGDEGSYYDPNSQTIYWNPHLAAVDHSRSVSPALLLVHESAHANQFIENPDQYIKDTNVGHPLDAKNFPWTNKEEKRVIEGPERRAADKLGEDHRTQHTGRGKYVSDPSER